MTHEFDHVRASFASSRPARAWAAAKHAAASGWHSSSFRGAIRRLAGGLARTSTPVLIRTVAIVIVVAAASQPLLMWMMPQTARPAMPPSVWVAIALVAAAAAWRAGDVATALPASHVARWLRR